MSDDKVPAPADPRRAGLLLAADALVMIVAAIDELSGLLEPEAVSSVRAALEPIDLNVHELQRRLFRPADPPDETEPPPSGNGGPDGNGS
jgi:hypothetical protein